MRPLMIAAAVLLAACSVNFGWNSPHVWVEQTEEFDLGAADYDAIGVLTNNGPITMSATPPGVETIHVIARKKAGGADDADASEALSCLQVARTTDGRTLDLKSEWTRLPRVGWGSQVGFELVLPARLSARLESHNGPITVKGMSGAVALTSHNGSLDVDAPAAAVNAMTHNGTIDYHGAATRLDLESHNGWIKAALLGGGVSGHVTAHNGSIVIDAQPSLSGTIAGSTSNGRVAVRAAANVCTIDDDSFRVEFGDASSGRLDVSTHNGSIRVE